MKSILFFLLIVVVINLRAQERNSPSAADGKMIQKIGTLEATNYLDREMIVTGRVAQVSVRPSVTFLNLDRPFPDSPFTVVIFHSHSQFNGDANLLDGKAIEIRGQIKNFKDKPEIALDSTNQLVVVGATNLSEFFKPASVPPAPAGPMPA